MSNDINYIHNVTKITLISGHTNIGTNAIRIKEK